MEECISITQLVDDTLSGIYCSYEDNDDDSYIEIQLDTTSYTDDDEENQLRISISSTSTNSLPDSPKEGDLIAERSLHGKMISNNNNMIPNNYELALTMCHVEDDVVSDHIIISPIAHDSRNYIDSKTKMSLHHSNVIQSEYESTVEVEFPLQNTIFFNPRGLPETSQTTQPDGQTTIPRTTCVVPQSNVDILYARKQPSLTRKTKEGMMKLLIKFRGIKIGSLFASFLKPQQSCSEANNSNGNKKSSIKCRTFFQCYQKRLINPSNGRRMSKQQWDLEEDRMSYYPFRSSSKKSSRVMEMDLGALRSIFNAMSRSKRRTQSSTSCDNSPIHQEFSLCSTNESSIQAAIAYCKSSCGLKSDFEFVS